MKIDLLSKHRRGSRLASALLMLFVCAGQVLAQQPAPQPARAAAPPQQPPKPPDPTFETLLATDAYKLYGEVRNVGQLLSTGGAGEIVEPIVKLAEPGKEFNSIINFLKKNAEALASSRLQFATWPARTDVPTVFVAIEFPTAEDAAKFAPKLETFLPTVLPTPPPESSPADPSAPPSQPPATSPSKPASSSPQTVQGFPYLITRAGNLVFISDKSFKFEKLHPAASKSLFHDANFRTVRDKFSSEPVFVFINVALEDKTKQQTQTQSSGKKESASVKKETEAPPKPEPAGTPTPDEVKPTEEKPSEVVLVAPAQASPEATPTKEQQAQRTAGRQVGQMLDTLGVGDPQWPEAVGMAVALDGNEYVVRAMLIDKPDAKLLPIPFVPQLVAGAPYNAEASSVLPEDTEMFVSASINFAQTYEGMRKQAEIKAKSDTHSNYSVYEKGVLISSGSREREPGPDVFTQFETKAGFKIKDDLIPALGSEMALAGSIKTLQGAGGFFIAAPAAPKPSPDSNDDKPKNEQVLPAFLVGVRDREAMKKLMPKILVGLGIGEANLLAQTEKHGDAEIVNYAGMFAYGFVGDFLVISDTAGVRRVVDASENHQTLSSATDYRNSRRWQPTRTLGQVYVSPILMDGYHEAIRQQAANLEPAMRDFMLGLNPKSEAITYALSNDGLGTSHELHLPKNLILMMVASISSAVKNPPPEANEMIAISALQVIHSSEQAYKAQSKNGPYATLQELIAAKSFPEEFDKYGYKYEITVMGDQFEAVATPKEYGTTGKRSFFVDKTGVVRGGDHGGGPATIADKPVQP